MRKLPVKLYRMKDVRDPGVMDPLIVRVAPYITTAITDSVEAALRPPEKKPTTFYREKARDIRQ